MNKMPLATLCVFFYNQEDYVEDTIRGALSQTYTNLEIILSDDCSTDNTYSTIEKTIAGYKGPHTIVVNRNKKNMGLVPHVNKVLFELSHGDYIFINGGDDISMPKRIEHGIDCLLRHEDISAVTFSRITIDKCGNEIGREEVDGEIKQSIDDFDYISSANFMTKGVGLSFRRNLLGFFGPLHNDCQTEDSSLRFRAMRIGKTLKSAEYGLKYRVHDTNISRNIYKLKTEPISRQYIDDIEKVKDSLDEKLYRVLMKKVYYYVGVRTLDEKKSKTNYIMKVVYTIIQKVKMKKYREEVRRIISK